MPPRERFLTAEEMARLNAVLTRDEFWCPHIVAIVRLLMLTGCRLGEIASLEWDWIRGNRIADITRAHVRRWFDGLSERPGSARSRCQARIA